jgi:hypothetical protein
MPPFTHRACAIRLDAGTNMADGQWADDCLRLWKTEGFPSLTFSLETFCWRRTNDREERKETDRLVYNDEGVPALMHRYNVPVMYSLLPSFYVFPTLNITDPFTSWFVVVWVFIYDTKKTVLSSIGLVKRFSTQNGLLTGCVCSPNTLARLSSKCVLV